MKRIITWIPQIITLILFVSVVVLISKHDTVSNGACLCYVCCWTSVGIMQGMDIQKKLNRGSDNEKNM